MRQNIEVDRDIRNKEKDILKLINIYQMIYEEVFCKTFSQFFFIFLCGGADKNNIRNKIRKQLEKAGFQILYPEDLFMDMLNRDKNSDLLEYENLLADSADIVCIICESMGSAVELGAFVQSEKFEQKLIICMNQRYARDKSFIMMGPVKHLEKKNKKAIIRYREKEPWMLGEKLIKQLGKLRRFSQKGNKMLSFENIAAYIAFIPLVTYFFKEIERKELYTLLRKLLLKNNQFPSKNYKQLFNASLKYMLSSGKLTTRFDGCKKDDILSLSRVGYEEVRDLLKLSWASNKTILQDKIRCAILKEKLNNKSPLSVYT